MSIVIYKLFVGSAVVHQHTSFSIHVMEFVLIKTSKQTTHIFKSGFKKVNRKVKEEPHAEAAANPRHQEEEKK